MNLHILTPTLAKTHHRTYLYTIGYSQQAGITNPTNPPTPIYQPALTNQTNKNSYAHPTVLFQTNPTHKRKTTLETNTPFTSFFTQTRTARNHIHQTTPTP